MATTSKLIAAYDISALKRKFTPLPAAGGSGNGTCADASPRNSGDKITTQLRQVYNKQGSLSRTCGGVGGGAGGDDDDNTNLQQPPQSKRKPFLPRVRVELCGLTIEARDRDSWKKRLLRTSTGPSSPSTTTSGTKCWRPGNKFRSHETRHRNEYDDVNGNCDGNKIIDAMAVRDASHYATRHVDQQVDVSARQTCAFRLDDSRHQTMPSSSSSSEFVGSLHIGCFPIIENKNKKEKESTIQRTIHWPIGKLTYTNRRPSTTRQSKTKSPVSSPNVNSPKHYNLSRLTSLSNRSEQDRVPIVSDRISPGERVILNKLASKRKLQNPTVSSRERNRSNGSNVDILTGELWVDAPFDLDQYLPTTHCMELATLPHIQGAKAKTTKRGTMRGSDYYDVVDNATQKMLEKHQLTMVGTNYPTTTSIGFESPSNRCTGTSPSTISNSRRTSCDEMLLHTSPESAFGDHNENCPLSGQFKPSHIGNFCPPNSPTLNLI